MLIQDFYVSPIFNTVVPSSEGAAGATTFARPPNHNDAIGAVPDTASEIVADVQWIMTTG